MTNLQSAIRDLSSADKRLLLARLLERRAGGLSAFPLSFAQERLWVICQLTSASALYNLSNATRFSGLLSIPSLGQVFREILRRHQMLRARFAETDGEPCQTILPLPEASIPFVDLSALDGSSHQGFTQGLLSKQAKQPFDLSSELLFRAALISLRRDQHVLFFSVHHIIADLWSMRLLERDILEIYRSYCDGKPSDEIARTIQYRDFALWQRRWAQGEVLRQQLEFWKTQLADAPFVLDLPTDNARPAFQGFRGARTHVEISDGTSKALDALNRAENATRFMTLFAAFQLFLFRYTGGGDFVVGTSVYHRTGSELERLIGLFVDLMAIRCRLSADDTFRQLLARVRENVLLALENRHVPFDQVVQEIQPERNARHTPLFQVLFALHAIAPLSVELPGVELTPIDLQADTAKFDLALHITETGSTLTAMMEYNSDLFEAATIRRFLNQYLTLLNAIAIDPDRRLCTLPLLTEPERSQALIEWNDTEQYYGPGSVQMAFEQQAEAQPAAIALLYDGRHLTYNELNVRANRLAHYLKSLGVGPEARVGICVERGLEMLVGVLGILKAGGGYLPLDSKYPLERLTFMIEDSHTEIVIVEQEQLERIPATICLTVCIDSEWQLIEKENGANPEHLTSAENVAYISYTSGSTGRPKGVEVLHKGILRLVRGAEYIELNKETRFLHLSPLSFDASTLEIWGPLLSGGQCVLYPRGVPTSEQLTVIARQGNVDTVWLTASLFNLIADDDIETLSGISHLLVGGEALSPAHVQRAKSALTGTKVINGYGPTEGTTFTCCYAISDEAAARNRISIGRPIVNTKIYILAHDFEPVPMGAAGQLCIGGAGLCRGYLNRPALTAEKFVPNPFGAEAGERIYQSGDVVKANSDGKLDYLGRTDNQVKVRGFRIELEEIEALLMQHDGVRRAVAVVNEEPAEKRVVAFIVPENSQTVSMSEIRTYLRERLPTYMVPAAIVPAEVIPLTPTGKVDREALLRLDSAKTADDDSYIAPRDEIERAVASVWQEVLRVDAVGINDNFFDLGGHSLLLVRVNRKLRDLFNKSLSMVEMFEHPTVVSLASHIASQGFVERSFRSSYQRAATRKRSIATRRAHRRDALTVREGRNYE